MRGRRRRPVSAPPRLLADARGELDSAWTTIGGWRMHALTSTRPVRPSSPTVILVHGIGVSSRYWIPTAVLLSPYARVHAVDMPGFGKSDKPAQVLDVAQLSDALASWMSASRIPPPCVVMGNSFGCQVAVELAVRHLDLVERIVLVGPTMDPQARSPLRQIGRLLLDAGREPPSQIAVALLDYLECGGRRLVRTFSFGLADPIEKKLPHVQVPALVVRGGRDPIVPQPWAEKATALLPAGRLIVIPGAAHAVNYNAPLELVRVVRPFILAKDSDEPT